MESNYEKDMEVNIITIKCGMNTTMCFIEMGKEQPKALTTTDWANCATVRNIIMAKLGSSQKEVSEKLQL